MIGTWNGNYRFDNQQIQKVKGFDKTNFKIVIDKFDGFNFEGKVVDEIETGGMTGEGEISGTIKNSKIRFTKQMPIQTLIDLKTGERLQTQKKHAPLFYFGTKINSDKFEGKWKFKRKIYFIFGLIPIPYRPGKGKWEMTFEKLQK
jgi:hypothetical protein